MTKSTFKPAVFFFPFLLLLGSTGYSLLDAEGFLEGVTSANTWILSHFGWLFSWGTFFFLALCLGVYFSPMAGLRIGGEDARPLLTRWQWFSVVLCTTVAIGILFWGASEPLYHYHAPPVGSSALPESGAAARFALSTMFMHWTFTPYGIYTMAGLVFALSYYNHGQAFSLGAMLYPLLGEKAKRWGGLIDALSLYSLVAGMAASLGAGVLTISGGMERYLGLAGSVSLTGGITLAVVLVFILSAISGLSRGIRWLSGFNTWLFIAFVAYVLLNGSPLKYLVSLGAEGVWDYVAHFIPRSLGIGMDKSWEGSWTVFYWANWLAWAPVSAVFLGRISVGYTVREFIHFNLLLPALFGALWMLVFSGNALYFDSRGEGMFATLQADGPEQVVYALFEHLPFPFVLGAVFLGTAFLSYVSGADANATAMGGLSAKGISPDHPEPAAWLKVAWGVLVGFTAWVMVSQAGVDGIKMASNLGGFPALLFLLGVAVGLLRWIVESWKKK